jgi:GDPmannose 4,6-dehydratase
LAAQSSVAASFSKPEYTAEIDALGALRLLEALRLLGMKNTCRFYQASTSELYGGMAESPQNEKTPFHPRSPYAVAKLFAYWTTINYREAYGMYACNGILFNHDSPRRGESFVSRKITRAVARIRLGLQDHLTLGNLNAKRDWGHAKDYVEMQWLMLQQEKADDFVIATGIEHSVRQFVETAFFAAGISLTWKGDGLGEQGYDTQTGHCLVSVDPKYFRPSDVNAVRGDATKAQRKLGWIPRIGFDELVTEMVNEDMRIAKGDAPATDLRSKATI